MQKVDGSEFQWLPGTLNTFTYIIDSKIVEMKTAMCIIH
jgi:hypothetical protein